MLKAVHNSIFAGRTGSQILKHDQEIAFLKVSPVKQNGKLSIGENEYEFEGEGSFKRKFFLNHGSQVLAYANLRFFRSRFEVYYGDHIYTVKKRGFFGSVYSVLENESEVGGLQPNKTWATETALDFPEDWPDSLAVFVFWLTHYQTSDRNTSHTS